MKEKIVPTSKIVKEEKQSSKKVIDTIFKEIKNVEMPQIKTVIASKHRKKIIIVAILLFVFVVFSFISLNGVSEIKEENEEIENLDNLKNLYNEGYEHEAILIPKSHEIDDFAIQQPISTKPTYSPNVSKVAWEVPQSLLKKQEYTKFLQLTGKNIKLNLQNDLLLVSDVPMNKFITVDIKISSNGDVDTVKIIQSSGSNAIDSSVVKVVGDTLKFMRPPSLGIISKSINATLTIELI